VLFQKSYLVYRVALLLALVMVISMLPMNVFGAPRGFVVNPVTPGSVPADNATTGGFIVRVNIADFIGRETDAANRFRLDFRLTGAHDGSNTYFPAQAVLRDAVNGLRIGDWDVVGISPGALTIVNRDDAIFRHSGREATVFVTAAQGIPAGAQGHFDIIIPGISPVGANSTLVIELWDWLANVPAAQQTWRRFGEIVDASLSVAAAGGVTVSYGDPVHFDYAAPVGNITIRESAVRNLTAAPGGTATVHGTSILLRAQRGYSWDVNALIGMGGRGLGITRGSGSIVFESTGANLPDLTSSISGIIGSGVGDNWRWYTRTGSGQREELILQLDIGRAPAPLESLIGELRLEGLWLLPGVGASRTGDVNVDVEVGRWYQLNEAQTIGSGANVFTAPDATGANPNPTAVSVFSRAARTNRSGGAWAESNLHVATRGVTGISVVEQSDLPTLISGRVSGAEYPARRVTSDIDGLNIGRPTENADWIQGDDGPRSIRLSELTPGTMFRGTVQPFEFRLEQEGVKFADMRWRIQGAGQPAATTPPGLADQHGREAWNWQNLNSIYSLTGGTSLQPTVARLVTMPIVATAGLRHLDVSFQLSVEAGFVGMNGTNEITVRVIAPGGTEEVVTIAYVEDPIAVSPISPAHVDTGGVFNIITPTQLENIVIQETEEGFFATDDEIWVYVVGTQLGRPVGFHWADIMFDTNRQPLIDSDSGMILGRGEMRTMDVGGHPTEVFVFPVLAPSVYEPATITLTHNFVLGNVSPGVDYRVVVTGPRIAPNSDVVWAHEFNRDPESVRGDLGNLPVTTVATPAIALRENPNTLFSSLPYSQTIVAFGAFEGEVVGPGVGPGIGIERPALVLHQYMQPVAVSDGPPVADPFFLWNNPAAPGVAVGMLQLRVFFEHIGGTGHFADGVATISGYDANGNLITVVLTTGSNIATVNGVAHDIATFAGASGPPNSITPLNIDNRIFVPLRFVANAFLLPVGFQYGIVTLG